jgi:hypothetical protein
VPSFLTDIELDTDAIHQDRMRYQQGGRLRVAIDGEQRLGDFFVRARGELLLKRSGQAGVDDLFVQLGSAAWEMKLGRFEAWDLGPKGKDTIVDDVLGTHYLGNMARGRASGDQGQLQMVLLPRERVGFEFAVLYGEEGAVDTDQGEPALAASRLAMRALFRGVAITTGVEHRESTGDRGIAATATFKRDPATILNLNLGRLLGEDDTVTTVGVNFIRGSFGAGTFHSLSDNDGVKGTETTLYGAYTIGLLGLKNASLTFGVSHSYPGGGLRNATEEKTSIRMRVFYLFT